MFSRGFDGRKAVGCTPITSDEIRDDSTHHVHRSVLEYDSGRSSVADVGPQTDIPAEPEFLGISLD